VKWWTRALVSLLLAALVGCSTDEAATPQPDSSVRTATVESCEPGEAPTPPAFGEGTALLDGSEGSVLLNVQVAQTDEERQFGLMFRKSLAMDEGMVFVFFEETSGGFYMKNTLLPLSIAYFDVDGKILKIVDMDPCETDSTLYDPGVPYLGALEVNQGAFDSWGVSEGDLIHFTPREPAPYSG
jgi:uncharacterized membrane protein (UPF0127 family)